MIQIYLDLFIPVTEKSLPLAAKKFFSPELLRLQIKLILIFAASKRNTTLSGLKRMMEEGIRHYLEQSQNIL